MDLITDIKFTWFNNDKTKTTRAIGILELGGAWTCQFYVVRGKADLFIGWPKQKGTNGKWYSLSGPKDDALDKVAQAMVVKRYKEALARHSEWDQG